MSRSVIVVGAGPAGMAAAIEAEARGSTVTVIDEAPRPGGQIYRQADPALALRDYAESGELTRKHALLGRFADIVPRIDYRPGVAAFAAFPNGELHVSAAGATEVLRADATILATGAREVSLPFPGWTTPGVMFAGGAQAILKAQQVLPGHRVVVAGSGPLPIVVAAQIVRAGGKVVALATLRSARALFNYPLGLWHGRAILWEGLSYQASLWRAGVKQLSGFVPIRAIGKERLERVVLARTDARGSPMRGGEREIDCDVLAINFGFAANSELAAMAGAELRHDSISGWIPITDEFGRTSVPGLFAAGDGAGLRGAQTAEIEGRIVGAAAARSSPTDDGMLRDQLAEIFDRKRRHAQFQRAVKGLLHVPLQTWSVTTQDTIVCRCENVKLREVAAALDEGHVTLSAVKRNTRAGMGFCGGRTCLPMLAALAELKTQSPIAEPMTPRPMARPVTFADIANQKRTAAS